MFSASFSSAFTARPQRSQTKRAGVLRMFLLACPHTAQLCEVYCAGTLMRSPPLSFCLYSIRYAASPKPLRRSARLRPALALALVPGFPHAAWGEFGHILKFKRFYADTHVVFAYFSRGLMQNVPADITHLKLQFRDLPL